MAIKTIKTVEQKHELGTNHNNNMANKNGLDEIDLWAMGIGEAEKAKREISKAGKKSWSDPIHHKKRVENQKRLWVNPVFHKQQKTKMAQGNTVKPNKPEIELLSILQTLYPDD
ncbi:hypothetical protein LCGC14_2700950, partial [marine sediment metagenome]